MLISEICKSDKSADVSGIGIGLTMFFLHRFSVSIEILMFEKWLPFRYSSTINQLN
jgi:hypothetical protein